MYSLCILAAENGGWTEWCHWTSCSVTCGDNGVTTRARSCDNPPPAHGGLECVGSCLENQTCSETPCSKTIHFVKAKL